MFVLPVSMRVWTHRVHAHVCRFCTGSAVICMRVHLRAAAGDGKQLSQRVTHVIRRVAPSHDPRSRPDGLAALSHASTQAYLTALDQGTAVLLFSHRAPTRPTEPRPTEPRPTDRPTDRPGLTARSGLVEHFVCTRRRNNLIERQHGVAIEAARVVLPHRRWQLHPRIRGVDEAVRRLDPRHVASLCDRNTESP